MFYLLNHPSRYFSYWSRTIYRIYRIWKKKFYETGMRYLCFIDELKTLRTVVFPQNTLSYKRDRSNNRLPSGLASLATSIQPVVRVLRSLLWFAMVTLRTSCLLSRKTFARAPIPLPPFLHVPPIFVVPWHLFCILYIYLFNSFSNRDYIAKYIARMQIFIIFIIQKIIITHLIFHYYIEKKISFLESKILQLYAK